jgi:hypothetical protein
MGGDAIREPLAHVRLAICRNIGNNHFVPNFAVSLRAQKANCDLQLNISSLRLSLIRASSINLPSRHIITVLDRKKVVTN